MNKEEWRSYQVSSTAGSLAALLFTAKASSFFCSLTIAQFSAVAPKEARMVKPHAAALLPCARGGGALARNKQGMLLS